MQCLENVFIFCFHYKLSLQEHGIYVKSNQNNPHTSIILSRWDYAFGSEIPGSATETQNRWKVFES